MERPLLLKLIAEEIGVEYKPHVRPSIEELTERAANYAKDGKFIQQKVTLRRINELIDRKNKGIEYGIWVVTDEITFNAKLENGELVLDNWDKFDMGNPALIDLLKLHILLVLASPEYWSDEEQQ